MAKYLGNHRMPTVLCCAVLCDHAFFLPCKRKERELRWVAERFVPCSSGSLFYTAQMLDLANSTPAKSQPGRALTLIAALRLPCIF
eukprot:1160249-Pelagomonas_calceolata.AAC.5